MIRSYKTFTICTVLQNAEEKTISQQIKSHVTSCSARATFVLSTYNKGGSATGCHATSVIQTKPFPADGLTNQHPVLCIQKITALQTQCTSN
jgi:hypothetical protein